MSKVANACVKGQWKTPTVVQVFDANVSSAVLFSLNVLDMLISVFFFFAGDITVPYRMSLNLEALINGRVHNK